MPKFLDKMIEIKVRSTIDGSLEPSLFWEADTLDGPKPLIVGLHTWSADRFNQVDVMQPWAEKLGWHLVLPEFRGPNEPRNPRAKEACGSKLAKQDIIDAVDYVKANYSVDADNIFIIGGSGGGHMALLMAGYAPQLWRAVASFVPITDVEAWYHEKRFNPRGAKYAVDIIECCGGEPSPATYDEYRYRSPLTYAAEIARSNTAIWTGVFDPSVPSHHGYDMFSAIFPKYNDARVFLNMFDGGHDMRLNWAEEWFLSQLKRHDDGTKSDGNLTG